MNSIKKYGVCVVWLPQTSDNSLLLEELGVSCILSLFLKKVTCTLQPCLRGELVHRFSIVVIYWFNIFLVS